MRKGLVILLFIGVITASGVRAENGLYFGPEYFYWHESAAGFPSVKESGWRAILGYRELPQRPQSGIVFPADIRVYGGISDYTGALQTSGGFIPAKTHVDYAGLLAELGIGYQWKLEGEYSLTPYVSMLGDFWWRGIQGQGGYDELWWTFPIRVGAELGTSRERGWLAGVSLKVPVYNQVGADIPGLGWTTTHPTTKLSGDAEVGYRINKRLSLTGFFESYWFGQSGKVGPAQVFQPETKTFTAGLKATVRF